MKYVLVLIAIYKVLVVSITLCEVRMVRITICEIRMVRIALCEELNHHHICILHHLTTLLVLDYMVYKMRSEVFL